MNSTVGAHELFHPSLFSQEFVDPPRGADQGDGPMPILELLKLVLVERISTLPPEQFKQTDPPEELLELLVAPMIHDPESPEP
jgi:hypothetical protein